MDEEQFAAGFDFFDSAAVTGVSISTRSSLRRTDSKAVTVWLASARWSVRAAQKIVSPSGIFYADSEKSSSFVGFGGVVRGVVLLRDHWGDAAHLVAEGAGGEAGFFEEAGEEMMPRAGSALMSAMRRPERRPWRRMASSASFLDGSRANWVRSGSFSGRENLDCGIAAAEEGGEDTVDEDNACAFGAGHH